MALTKIALKPGIDKEGTQYSASNGWFDSDRVRFRMGRPERIGGWQKYSPTAIKGIARSLFDWTTRAADKYLGIGTNLKFYVEIGGTYSDITPLKETTAAGDVTFAIVGAGDATITVSDTGSNASTGDFVTFSGAVSLGGNITADVLNQEYQVATVVDGNSYTIEAKDTDGNEVLAAAGDSGNGGAAVVGEYQITTGTNTYLPSTGYGAGSWGETAWGGGTALTFGGQLRLYTQDVFDDDLIFCPRGGGIYYWDESAGVTQRARNIRDMNGDGVDEYPNSPSTAFQVMVSPLDRHVIAFGTNPLGSGTIDPLLVRWSDQEDALDWVPTAINSAGGQVLSGGSAIIGAIRTRQEILIFTDSAIHSMRYSGSPFVFSFSVVSQDVSMLSPRAAIGTGEAVFFMDREGFYAYRGAVQRIPCSVYNYVFSSLSKTQAYKVFASHNPDHNEVTWFYPVKEGESDTTENSRYVTFNYQEQVWTVGSMARGAWVHASNKDYPIASSTNTGDSILTNYLYSHELGHHADGASLGAYIESGQLSIADGDSLAFIRRVIPDFRFTDAGTELSNSSELIKMTIKGTDYPLKTMSTLAEKYVYADTSQLHVRGRAREIVLRIEDADTSTDLDAIDYGWAMGDFRFDLRTDGRRG
jgi:hypothetical protein